MCCTMPVTISALINTDVIATITVTGTSSVQCSSAQCNICVNTPLQVYHVTDDKSRNNKIPRAMQLSERCSGTTLFRHKVQQRSSEVYNARLFWWLAPSTCNQEPLVNNCPTQQQLPAVRNLYLQSSSCSSNGSNSSTYRQVPIWITEANFRTFQHCKYQKIHHINRSLSVMLLFLWVSAKLFCFKLSEAMTRGQY